MSAKDTAVTVGGEPRIDFLPPEIRQKKLTRRTIRGLAMLLVVVLVGCIVAYAGVTSLAIASQVQLSVEQDRTQELLRAQSEYSDVRLLQQTVESAKNARLVASGNEIMWKPVMDQIEATIPANQGIPEVKINSYVVGEIPPTAEDLQDPYQASIEMKVLFERISPIADWVDRLRELPDVAGVTFGGATLNDQLQLETIVIVALDERAFERRYFETQATQEETAE